MFRFVVLLILFTVTSAAKVSGHNLFARNHRGRITGGEPTDITQVPYQVALEWYGYQTCGASIIGQEWAITSAECTYETPASQYQIRSGSRYAEEGGTIHNVVELHEHPQFVWYVYDYDITILRVDPPFTWSDSVAPVALPQPNVVPPVGTLGVISGWGQLSSDVYESASELYSTTVPIVDHDQCVTAYAQSDSVYNEVPVTDNEICAGYFDGGQDACNQDAGGPLVVDGVQIGIVSWSYQCGDPGLPSVYTSVSAVIDFIGEVTGIQPNQTTV